jgi:hypothetical protein
MTTPTDGGPAMTPEQLRHWRYEFAGRAMPQILHDMHRCVELGVAGYSEGWRQHAAAEAVKLADALLAELARTDGGGG